MRNLHFAEERLMPRMLMITSVALALAWGGFACASPRDREQQALLKKAEMAAEQGLADARDPEEVEDD